MTRLGSSPPPKCLCGHDFHAGPCGWSSDDHKALPAPARWDAVLHCHCPNGELDGDR